jgi:alkanesulfonate monooxygenase SsuD/methylene tetrahydromethanopterin reductase-like flavin-dependent oxidoreductase (luciferase family)
VGVNLGLLFGFRNPARWRRSFVDTYRDELRAVREAEALGYDTIWLTEHHFADDGYSPSVLPIMGAIAARTERVRIGSFLILLPLNNAIRLAEDVATLDVISNGRIDLGVGQGYAVHEFAAYGISRKERLSRFVEGIDVLRGLWTKESFSYRGRHYTIDDARLMPRPVQSPHPPLWIGARGAKGIARAGRLGAHLLGLSSPEMQATYDAALAEAGHDPATRSAVQLHWVHVARTEDEAWANAGPHFHHVLETYGRWVGSAGDFEGDALVANVPPERELRTTTRPLLFPPLFGTPDQVHAALARSMARIRTTHLCLAMHLPGMDPRLSHTSMELFAREVAPRLGRS